MKGRAGDLIHDGTESGPPEWLLKEKQETISDCRMFYAGIGKPMTESLMCFSWECGPGWNDVLSKLSYMIEALNVKYYQKYRVRCEAEQIKEKFGTLRVYTRTVIDPPVWKAAVPNVIRRFSDWLNQLKVDYGLVKVIDSKRHVEYEYQPITKREYDDVQNGKSIKCTNVEYATDGKSYYSVTKLDKYEKFHYVPTKHRILHCFVSLIWKLSCITGSWSVSEPTVRQRVISKYVTETVEKYVKEAEDECYNRCEDCGTHIGEGWNPRCEMKGWISYVCEKCAKKRGGEYVKMSSRKGKDNEDKD